MAAYNAETQETVILRTATALVAGVLLMFASMTVVAQERTVESKDGSIKVETIADGLDEPWGMAFLPDGRLLVTEKGGTLRIVAKDGTISDPVKGVPKVIASGQGGLLDVALDPEFGTNNLVYLSYSEGGDGGVGTAVARGKLNDAAIEDTKIIFRMTPKVQGPNHFGSRLVFAPDGKLFVTLGDRFKFEPAQDLKSHLGKVVRINPDGSVPDDNPFAGKDDALPEIWSYGHRNVQGGAINPKTGKLWTIEFGPKGGDELNIPEPGKNYGWPVVSWGTHYDGKDIPDPPTHPEFADAVKQWTPVISPSGMTFYTGEVFPNWQGDLLIAGLSSAAIVRLTLDGDKVASEDRIAMGSRIRDVAQGPDGAVYALTDGGDGKLLRLTPGK